MPGRNTGYLTVCWRVILRLTVAGIVMRCITSLVMQRSGAGGIVNCGVPAILSCHCACVPIPTSCCALLTLHVRAAVGSRRKRNKGDASEWDGRRGKKGDFQKVEVGQCQGFCVAEIGGSFRRYPFLRSLVCGTEMPVILTS